MTRQPIATEPKDEPVVPRSPLDIEDYLDATSEASARTRSMVLLLAVASVLAFAGLLNSLQSQWMLERVHELQDIRGSYTQKKLGDYPTREKHPYDFDKAVDLYEHRYFALCEAVERAYVDTAMIVRVPFLGFGFDVNDLGLLGGIGFIVILSCYRFFLSREIDNLRVSFNEARAEGPQKLEEFYRLLAMRQVFTVPIGSYIKRSFFLLVVPKAISWLPLLVLTAVTVNDVRTADIGHQLGWNHFVVNVGCAIVSMVILFLLSLSVTIRLRRMDRIWVNCWTYIETEKRAPGQGRWILDGGD